VRGEGSWRIFAVAASALLLSATAEAKTKLTFAFVSDATHEAYVHAIREGIVKSDKIELEMTTIGIPALTQALLGKQYDIIETSVVGLPRAMQRGLNVQMLFTAIGRLTPGPTLDLWVKRDSPIKSIEELKGKQVASFGLSSTALSMMRVALAKEYGFDVSLQNGDIKFVELPTTAIPAAIQQDRVAAGALLYNQVYEAERTGDFRSIWSAAPVLRKLSGARPVLPVIIGFPERTAADPAAYREFNRMLTESLRYAAAHEQEVTEKIGKQANANPDYLKRTIAGVAQFETPIEEADLKAIDYFWQAAKSIGMIETAPSARDLAWPDAMKK
jgi:NitT/TauT family transport system substrate-binding protein